MDHSREWTVSGRVVDADTQQPLTSFRVTPGQTEQFRGIAWSGLRATEGSNGLYTVYVSKRSTLPQLKVEADGYLPTGMELPPRDATNVNFTLKKGSGPKGTVVRPNGKPDVGATVILLKDDPNEAGVNDAGQLTAYGNRAATYVTDANGAFSCKPVYGMKAIAVGSSNGLIVVNLESFATNSTITLPPFGKITGTLKRTSGPGTNETLDVTFAGSDRPSINMWLPTDTDNQGRFTFDRVPAGHLQISYRIPVGKNGWRGEPLQEVDVQPGQTLEVKINTTDRAKERPENEYQPQPLTPVPGKHVKGIVLRPNGQPAAEAQVALQLTEGPFNLSLGRGVFVSSGLQEQGLLVNAAPDGSFDLPLYEKAVAVVAVNEEGFAQVSLAEFNKSPRLQLQKFGRVEGTLRVGRHLGTNEIVDLSPGVPRWTRNSAKTNAAPEIVQPLMYDAQSFSARIDGDGKFAFAYVPPGERELYRRVPQGKNSWTHSQIATVDVPPGGVVVTNVGGSGRTVTGKVHYNGDLKVDFQNGMGVITTPSFEIFEKAQKLKTQAERQAFYESPEVQKIAANSQSFSLLIAADSTFRGEDILPGTYEFHFQPRFELDPNSRSWVILTSSQTFTVPAAKNEQDDSTVDLGTIELKKMVLPTPEEATGK